METEMWFIPSHYSKHVNHHAFSSQSLPPRILTALRMRTEFELISNLQGRVGIWLPVGLSDSLRDVLWFKSSWWSVTLTDNTPVNWKKKAQKCDSEGKSLFEEAKLDVSFKESSNWHSLWIYGVFFLFIYQLLLLHRLQ